MPSERIQLQVKRLLDEAEAAVAAGDWTRVRERARQALALDPGNADAQVYAEAAERGLAQGGAGAAEPESVRAVPVASEKSARPGETVTFEIDVANGLREPAVFACTLAPVDGALKAEWCRISAPAGAIASGATGRIGVEVRVPKGAAARPGRHRFIVTATPAARPEAAASAECALEVKEHFCVLFPKPKLTIDSTGNASLALRVTNCGNIDLAANVSVRSKDGKLTLEVTPPSLSLRAGEGPVDASFKLVTPPELAGKLPKLEVVLDAREGGRVLAAEAGGGGDGERVVRSDVGGGWPWRRSLAVAGALAGILLVALIIIGALAGGDDDDGGDRSATATALAKVAATRTAQAQRTPTRPAATRTPTVTPTPTPTHTATATATPRPLSIALTAPSELGCDGRQRATVVATVTDEEGEPVEGVRVTFAVSGPGAVAPASATTARDGTASTVLRATGAPNEVVTVKASAANARSADIGVTCQAVVE